MLERRAEALTYMRTTFVFPLLISSLIFTGCGSERAGGDGKDPDDPIIVRDDAGSTPDDEDSGNAPTQSDRVALGRECDCDDECAGTNDNPGICVNGICMTEATEDCSEAGSQEECPDGSRCWGVNVGDTSASICWPDCDAHECDGECDSDGSCVFSAENSCDNSCSDLCTPPYDGTSAPTGDCPPNSHAEGDGCVCDEGFSVNEDRTGCVAECMDNSDCSGGMVCEGMVCVEPPCTQDSCPDGTVCSDSGSCVVDVGTPPTGPVPTMCTIANGIPDWHCTSDCRSLVQFEPDMGTGTYDGWWDYPLNGETSSDQYRSYIRRDVMNLVKYATSMTNCLSATWMFGNGGLLGLGDMSESNGAIPGTREGSPGHPEGTHVNGNDMDIAYYQIGTANNTLRPVCEHTRSGADQYHCVAPPEDLDVWRTALFIAYLHDNSNLRVIGVDGQAGPLIESAITQLCANGWIPSGSNACRRGGLKMTYETTDMGYGWYYFHHHHLHISVN